MSIHQVIMSCVFSLASVITLEAQILLHDYRGTAPIERFGVAIVEVGDLNRDGAPELAIATGNGRVDVMDGSSGKLKASLTGFANEDFGFTMAEIGDVNNDGVPDLAVGAPGFSDPLAPGRVVVFSGANASVLYSVSGIAPGDRFGASLIAMELSGDSTLDLVVGAPGRDVPTNDAGRVASFDGKNGFPLSSANGIQAAENFGSSLAKISDMNGDGRRDLAVGGPGGNQPPMSNFFGGTGEVRILSSATFNTLKVVKGEAPGDLFGTALASTRDLDGDRLAEIVVGAPGRDEGPGIDAGLVGIYSSASGELIDAFPGAEVGERFGEMIVDLGNVDAKGGSDFAVGSPNWGSLASGRVEIIDAQTAMTIAEFKGTSPLENVGKSIAKSRGFGADKPGEFYFGAIGAAHNGVYSGQVKGYSFGRGVYGSLAQGNVGQGAGGPFAVLTVNGSLGGRYHHRVDVEMGAPMTVSVAKAPNAVSISNFVIFGMNGVASAASRFELAGGIGTMLVTPCDAAPGMQPSLFVLADSFGTTLCPSLIPATPTPWSALLPPIYFPLTWTLQGLIEVAPGVIEITNAVVISNR
ncbi:MAG: hypothetical protein ACI97A_000956 [Planctomycetota bacterium]|jgi:hypothetical protein